MKVSTPGVQKHFSQRPEPLTNLSPEIWRSALLDHVAQNSARQISKFLQKNKEVLHNSDFCYFPAHYVWIGV